MVRSGILSWLLLTAGVFSIILIDWNRERMNARAFFSNENRYFSSFIFLEIRKVCVQKRQLKREGLPQNLIAPKWPKFMRLKLQCRIINVPRLIFREIQTIFVSKFKLKCYLLKIEKHIDISIKSPLLCVSSNVWTFLGHLYTSLTCSDHVKDISIFFFGGGGGTS